MAIDLRFTKDRFEGEVKRDSNSRALSDALQAEVLEELHDVIAAKMREIVERLNGLGHHLTEYYPPKAGDISFRDDRAISGFYECDLRVGADIVVSVGYEDARSESVEAE